jgi:hypothetical protein
MAVAEVELREEGNARVGEEERGKSLKICDNQIKTRGLQHLTYTHPIE